MSKHRKLLDKADFNSLENVVDNYEKALEKTKAQPYLWHVCKTYEEAENKLNYHTDTDDCDYDVFIFENGDWYRVRRFNDEMQKKKLI